MSDFIVDVILPEATTADVVSPSFENTASVFIPGPQGPQGAEGPVNQFKYITGENQVLLSPTGLETLNFIASTGISINLDSNLNPYKSIKINAAPLSGYFEGENVIGYKANLTAGSDSYYITYPNVLSTSPRSVVCAFQNTVDDIAYYFNLGSINPTGFYISFSDNLLNNGYCLNIQVKK